MSPPDDLRRTLLDASLDLIAREGLEGFSMREVARRAGVSHQAPYHHFSDREAILAAVVAEGFQLLREAMLEALDGADEPVTRLTALGKAYVAFALKHPAHFKLMFRSELVRAEKHDEAKACAESAFDLLVKSVDAVAQQRYGRSDPTLVLVAWSIAHGLSTLLLEGKLEHQIGAGKRAQREAGDRVLEAFETLMRAGRT